jgi:transcriptional regulator with XRE-family HTH domain
MPRLRELRLDAALSQMDLAEQSGVSRTTIARLETGDPGTEILPSTLRKLAQALKVSPAELRRKS